MKAKLQKKYDLYIGGEWVAAGDKELIAVHSPIDGKELAKIAEATEADVEKAVVAAQEAFESWKKTTPQERQQVLTAIADLIDANKEHLATVETLDNGKPIRETMAADVPFAADHFRYFGGLLRGREGSATMLDENTLSLILREPIGVVGQIIPWSRHWRRAARSY